MVHWSSTQRDLAVIGQKRSCGNTNPLAHLVVVIAVVNLIDSNAANFGAGLLQVCYMGK